MWKQTASERLWVAFRKSGILPPSRGYNGAREREREREGEGHRARDSSEWGIARGVREWGQGVGKQRGKGSMSVLHFRATQLQCCSFAHCFLNFSSHLPSNTILFLKLLTRIPLLLRTWGAHYRDSSSSLEFVLSHHVSVIIELWHLWILLVSIPRPNKSRSKSKIPWNWGLISYAYSILLIKF